MNPTLNQMLRDQASAIYKAWAEGNVSTAIAMLKQVPPKRIAYVTMTMTILAVHEGTQYAMSKFIEGVTQ